MADLTQDRTSSAAPDRASSGESEGYRPLSLLALGGFLLSLLFGGTVLIGGILPFAVLYRKWLIVAVVVTVAAGWLIALSRKRGVVGTIGMALAGLATLVGLGSLVAFSGTSPWLLPSPIWILVAVALATCLLARSRIAASEGTLGGSALAGWGVLLTLFFALNYGAYSLSNTYAVRSQGREATDEFIELLKQGKTLEAFLLTKPSNSRPSGGDLRRSVEEASNTPAPPAGGAYTAFTHSPTIRIIQMSGPDATFEKVSIHQTHERNGFQVRTTYRASGDLGLIEFAVLAFGQESNDGATVRRQWHIEVGPPSPEMMRSIHQSEEGRGLIGAIESTKMVVGQWLEHLNTRRIGEAYLSTVSPDKRQAQAKALLLKESGIFSLTGLALGGGLQASRDRLEDFDKGIQSFQSGSILADGFLDDTDLYPPKGSPTEAVRQEIIDRVQKVLSGKGTDDRLEMSMVEIPLYRRTAEAKDTISIRYPVQMISRADGKARFIEGELEIIGPWSNEPLPPHKFQVRRLRLLRGHMSPELSRGPPR